MIHVFPFHFYYSLPLFQVPACSAPCFLIVIPHLCCSTPLICSLFISRCVAPVASLFYPLILSSVLLLQFPVADPCLSAVFGDLCLNFCLTNCIWNCANDKSITVTRSQLVSTVTLLCWDAYTNDLLQQEKAPHPTSDDHLKVLS